VWVRKPLKEKGEMIPKQTVTFEILSSKTGQWETGSKFL
jgi:hypothetical protein